METPGLKTGVEVSGRQGSATAAEKVQHDEGHVASLKADQAVTGAADEKKLVRKLDMFLIPLVMAL